MTMTTTEDPTSRASGAPMTSCLLIDAQFGASLHPISRTTRIFCFLLVFLDSSPNGKVGNSVILSHWEHPVIVQNKQS